MATATPLKLILDVHPDEDKPWLIKQKIFDILKIYLQPFSNITSSAAAQELNQLFPLNRPLEGDEPNEAPGSFLWEMWELFIEVVEQIPWQHPSQDRLTELLKVLQVLPNAVTVEMKNWGAMTVWTDLPLLGPVLIENSYDINPDDESDAQMATRSRNQNFEGFCARLTRDGIADRSIFAVYALGDALEQEPDPRSRAYHKQGPQLDLYVPIAAEWIILAGRVLYRHSVSTGGALSTSVPRGRNWHGEGDFSAARWQFWKKRFGEVKVHGQTSEETKNLAAKAEEIMNEIEAEAEV